MKYLFLIFLLSTFSINALENDSKRLAAKRVVAAFEVKSYKERSEDMVKAIKSATNNSSIDEKALASKFETMLKSEEFNHDMENIYIESFTENELNEIATMLQNESLKKFLSSRMDIMTKNQQVMRKHLAKAL